MFILRNQPNWIFLQIDQTFYKNIQLKHVGIETLIQRLFSGGLMVSILAFSSDDQTLNTVEVYRFVCKICVWKEDKLKKAGVCQCVNIYLVEILSSSFFTLWFGAFMTKHAIDRSSDAAAVPRIYSPMCLLRILSRFEQSIYGQIERIC